MTKKNCVLGVELTIGIPVVILGRTYGGGFHTEDRGTVLGFKENPKSTSVLVDTGKLRPRQVAINKVVVDAKVILGGVS